MLERIAVGARVIITEFNLANIRTDCYSTAGKFLGNTEHLNNFTPLCANEVVGEVTHNFPPGYDLTVKFGDKSYHLGGSHVTVINREAWADEQGYMRYAVHFATGPNGAEKHQAVVRVPAECSGSELVEILKHAVDSACSMKGATECYAQCYEMLPVEEA